MAHGSSSGRRSLLAGGASTTQPGGGVIPATVTESGTVQNVVPLLLPNAVLAALP